MHEYPVTKQILRIALDTAEKNHAKKILKINLTVGSLSGFIGESIQMYFDILSRDTIAEGAKITVHTVKQKLKCESCGHYFTRKKYSFKCPRCGGQGMPAEIGKEFYIKDMEILN